MYPKKFQVSLTNGTTIQHYIKHAFNEKEAIILAQAEAIQEGRGYELVECQEILMEQEKFTKALYLLCLAI